MDAGRGCHRLQVKYVRGREVFWLKTNGIYHRLGGLAFPLCICLNRLIPLVRLVLSLVD